MSSGPESPNSFSEQGVVSSSTTSGSSDCGLGKSTESLPSITNKTYSSCKRPRRNQTYFKKLPPNFRNKVIRCVEFPNGIYIDKSGVPRKDVELSEEWTGLASESEEEDEELGLEEIFERIDRKYEKYKQDIEGSSTLLPAQKTSHIAALEDDIQNKRDDAMRRFESRVKRRRTTNARDPVVYDEAYQDYEKGDLEYIPDGKSSDSESTEEEEDEGDEEEEREEEEENIGSDESFSNSEDDEESECSASEISEVGTSDNETSVTKAADDAGFVYHHTPRSNLHLLSRKPAHSTAPQRKMGKVRNRFSSNLL
jgi:hypothetical protein